MTASGAAVLQFPHDPFRIEGPALISFSGGRTSGYMLWRIIQAHGGTLPSDVIPTFANTGKEHEATLDFVRDCGDRWGVIRWLERRPRGEWAEVDHATAARNGEPFAELIAERKYLPNAITRFCTEELKIRTMRRFARSMGWDSSYVQVIGLRADEPHRVARVRARNATSRDGQDCRMPLADAGISVREVTDFWSRQNFDLRLPNHNGKTPAGNCDLCMLKATGTLVSLIRAEPERADWWIAQERVTGGTFRKPNRPMPSYGDLREVAARQFELLPLDGSTECFCHD